MISSSRIGRLRRLAVVVAALTGIAGAADAAKLEVGYIPVLGVSQLFVMEGEGWTKEAGLELNITRFESGPAMIQALASGKLDVAFGGVTPMIVAKANGIDVSVLAATATEEIVLVGRGTYAKTVKSGVKAGPAVSKFFEAEGRKLKLSTQPSGSVPDTVARFWLNKIANVPADHVEVIGMGIEKTQQAILANAVDAAVIREPVITILHDLDPDVQVLATGGEIFPGQPGSVVTVRNEVRKADPAAVDLLIKLHVRATYKLQTDPKSTTPAVYKFIGAGLTEQSVIERALTSPYSKFIADPRLILESTDKMQKFQAEQGSLQKTIDLSTLFDSGPYERAETAFKQGK